MKSRFLRRFLAAAVLAGALGMVPQTSGATSLADLSLEQIVDASTYVVRGEVQRVWAERIDGTVWTRAELAVHDVMKGPDSPSTLIVDSLGGTLDGTTTTVPLASRFSVGEDVVVFLDTVGHDADRLSPISMFRGKFTVRRAPGDREPIVTQYFTAPETTWDHRFLPSPPPDKRVYLSDFLDRVQQHLRVGWDGEPIPGMAPDVLEAINAPERRLRR